MAAMQASDPSADPPDSLGSGPDGDRIELRGLLASGICGALPEEQERPQPLQVDLDVYADLAAAGASDDLADTVDYGALAAAVEAVIVGEAFVLLERLAQRIADVVLAADPRVAGVTVAVRKLRPPVPQLLDTSGVRITRTRLWDHTEVYESELYDFEAADAEISGAGIPDGGIRDVEIPDVVIPDVPIPDHRIAG